MTRKQPKGTVVVSSRRGMLRLQLPRHLFNGAQKYLYLGLPDTPPNRQAAQLKADAIAADIAFDRFDSTLKRYQPQYISKPEESMNLAQLWDLYSAFKERSLSITTIQKDFKRIRNHILKFPSQRLEDARKIRKYLLDSFPIQTVKKILMQINACCNWALGEELIAINPFAELPVVKGGRPKKAINPFTDIERCKILNSFWTHPKWRHYYRFVKFLFLTGCRTSEAVGLCWKHIDDDLKTITFSEAVVERQRKDTKTHSIRKFPINPPLKELLIVAGAGKFPKDAPVFPSPTGKTIDAHNFLNRAWKEVLSEEGIEYRPQYNTRHTFITSCLEGKIPVTQVAKWVGNSPRTIWTHYAGLVNEMEVPE